MTAEMKILVELRNAAERRIRCLASVFMTATAKLERRRA